MPVGTLDTGGEKRMVALVFGCHYLHRRTGTGKIYKLQLLLEPKFANQPMNC